MRYNILLFYPYNQSFTGGPRVVLNLSKTLDSHGFTPIVISQKASPLTDELDKTNLQYEIIPFPEVLDVYGGKTLGYSFLKKLASLRATIEYNLAMERVCKKYDVHAIWGRGVKSILLTALAAKRLSTPLLWDIGMEKESKGLMQYLHLIGLTTSDVVVTEGASQPVSIFGKATYSLFKSKFKAISPGIDPEIISRLKQKCFASKNDHEQQFRILTVATISPRKNQLMILEAVRKVREKYPQVCLDIVGPSVDENYFQQCREYVNKYHLKDCVVFHGWQEDIPRFMDAASLFVLASKNEGIPYVIHEAMHAKLPIVATPVGGIPDVIENGQTGWLVKNDSVDGLVDTIEFCLLNPDKLNLVAENAENFASLNLSTDNWSSNYISLFKKIISSKAIGS